MRIGLILSKELRSFVDERFYSFKYYQYRLFVKEK